MYTFIQTNIFSSTKISYIYILPNDYIGNDNKLEKPFLYQNYLHLPKSFKGKLFSDTKFWHKNLLHILLLCPNMNLKHEWKITIHLKGQYALF